MDLLLGSHWIQDIRDNLQHHHLVVQVLLPQQHYVMELPVDTGIMLAIHNMFVFQIPQHTIPLLIQDILIILVDIPAAIWDILQQIRDIPLLLNRDILHLIITLLVLLIFHHLPPPKRFKIWDFLLHNNRGDQVIITIIAMDSLLVSLLPVPVPPSPLQQPLIFDDLHWPLEVVVVVMIISLPALLVA